MVAPWLIAIIVSTFINAAVYLITPKPKAPKPDSVQDIQYPTAEAGKPIPKMFGSCRVTSPNVLWYGEPGSRQYEVKA